MHACIPACLPGTHVLALRASSRAPLRQLTLRIRVAMVPSLPSIAFKALDGKIYAHNELRGAEPFALKGVNWFGAEGEGKCPDGLWQRPAADYLDSIVSLGFNSIRLPLAVDNVLDDPFVNKWSLTANEELQGLRSLAVLERLITMAGARGLLVLLDMHRLSAKIWPTTHGLWFSPQMSSQRLHDAWERLARRFCSHWNVFAADLFNEPWGANLALATGRSINTSESTSRKHANREGDRQGIRATDHAWSVAASSIGATVNSICPRWLIFVEGVGSASDEELCELCFWGENLLGLRWASRNMPLVQLPVPDQLVFSPHVYGPGTNSKMFYFNRSAFPQYPDNMIAIWRQHFLEPARLAGATLVVGEWGGNYLGDDELWQDKFKSFLLEEHLSSFYWALNPNSGDTGGLLLDDWQTVHTAKAHLLAELPSSSVNLTLAGLPAFPCPTPAEQSTSASSDRFYKCGEGNTLSTPGVSSGEGWCVHAAQTCNGIAECKDSSDERQDLCHSLRRKQPCITTSGQDPLRPCVFPFRYRGEEFTSCSMDDAINGLAWCPTQVDDIGEFFEFSKWGACGPGCPREVRRRLIDGCVVSLSVGEEEPASANQGHPDSSTRHMLHCAPPPSPPPAPPSPPQSPPPPASPPPSSPIPVLLAVLIQVGIVELLVTLFLVFVVLAACVVLLARKGWTLPPSRKKRRKVKPSSSSTLGMLAHVSEDDELCSTDEEDV